MKFEGLLTKELRLRITGDRLLDFLNHLSLHGVRFYQVIQCSPDSFELTLPAVSVKAFQSCALDFSVDIVILRRRGFWQFLCRIRRRSVIFTALFIMLLWVCYLSTCIWEINVYGNDRISTASIIDVLEEFGIGIGSSGLHIHNEQIRSLMQAKLPELSYLAIQIRGSRADIIVRERIPKPDMVGEKQIRQIIADKTGLVTRISTLSGKALIRRGDLVLQGETLITGEFTDAAGTLRSVNALGEIWARTWQSNTAAVPLTYLAKQYTGEQVRRIAWKICNFRINFYADSGISYACYDKITKEHRCTLWGFPLPWSRIETICSEYDPVTVFMEESLCHEIAEAGILTRLRTDADEITVCSDTSYVSKNHYILSLTTECSEQIGSEIP